MDPGPCSSGSWPRRLPRTRGDGPHDHARSAAVNESSPHARGWTRWAKDPTVYLSVFPARAGMDPSSRRGRRRMGRLPRTRGDGPSPRSADAGLYSSSPHARGWTLALAAYRRAVSVFPARAGMDPEQALHDERLDRLPRTRGDGPLTIRSSPSMTVSSPHARGWTVLSPSSRPACRVFPARAGMDPPRGGDQRQSRGLPRTRGDGPARRTTPENSQASSPHARGWTRRGHRPHARLRVFPARAGMDPFVVHPWRGPTRLPRTRGDGPRACVLIPNRRASSPHARGWTRSMTFPSFPAFVFPARAGMDPRQVVDHGIRKGLPRTRGDGPC